MVLLVVLFHLAVPPFILKPSAAAVSVRPQAVKRAITLLHFVALFEPNLIVEGRSQLFNHN